MHTNISLTHVVLPQFFACLGSQTISLSTHQMHHIKELMLFYQQFEMEKHILLGFTDMQPHKLSVCSQKYHQFCNPRPWSSICSGNWPQSTDSLTDILEIERQIDEMGTSPSWLYFHDCAQNWKYIYTRMLMICCAMLGPGSRVFISGRGRCQVPKLTCFMHN